MKNKNKPLFPFFKLTNHNKGLKRLHFKLTRAPINLDHYFSLLKSNEAPETTNKQLKTNTTH